MGESADGWLDFQFKFRELANEEARVPQHEPLGVHAVLEEHPEVWEQNEYGSSCYSLLSVPPHGLWQYRARNNPDIEARFRALAARAGIALGHPRGTNSE